MLQLLEDASPIAAAMIELLLDKQLNDSAGQVLHVCEGRYPDSLRILQLKVLYFSRQKKYDEAIALGEKVLRRNKEDEESLGILAGAYKRSWQQVGMNSLLERAHHLYTRGWNRSHKLNHYLGINSSATSILLGRFESAGSVAADIHRQLIDRRNKLRFATLSRLQHLGSWDQLTLAESALQLQNFEEAIELYRTAYQNPHGTTGTFNIAIEQARALLAAFGWSDTEIETWVNRLR
jgi:tetratricopeptide (TPR) repeat protein